MSEAAASYRSDIGFLLASPHLRSDPQAVGSGGTYIAAVAPMSDCRRLFITHKGYVGIGPDVVRKEDICCIISGCRVPCVLRSTGRGSYLLVGETFVQGAMSGELLRPYRWSLSRPYREIALE